LNTTESVKFGNVTIAGTGSSSKLYFNDSGKLWEFSTSTSSSLFNFKTHSGANALQLSDTTGGATAQNLIGTSSYSGAIALKALGVASQTADLFVVANSTHDVIRVNATGWLNVTTGICLGGVCNSAWPAGSGGVTGNGTSGYISVFSGAAGTVSNVSSSLIYQNSTTDDKASGNRVYINGSLFVNGPVFENSGVEQMTTLTYMCPFLVTQAATMCYPYFLGSALASGTLANPLGTPMHPGSITFLSTTAASSGYRFTTDVTAFWLNGSEEFRFSMNLTGDTVGNNSLIRIGFLDSISTAAVADGVYFQIYTNASGAYAQGYTANNSVYNFTSNYSLTNNTWANYKIDINPNASNVTFSIYNDAAVLLWNQTLVRTATTGVPIAAGRQTGAGFTAYRVTAGTARVIGQIDYMVAEIRAPRRIYG
jgi:hypothetical protein